MFRPPPYARIAVVALLAAVAFGTLATTSRLPIVPAGVAAATRPPTQVAPGAWFDMNVSSADIALWAPATMPAGAPPIRPRAGILVDLDTGEILWERQPDLELAPASLTKVLTSLVALENFSPDQPVIVTSKALGQSSADTLMGLRDGETLTVRELLDGLIGSVAERAAFHPEYGEETQIPISRVTEAGSAA